MSYRAQSLTHFFGGMKRNTDRLAPDDFASERLRYRAFIQANFDHDTLLDVASFMAMELQSLSVALDGFMEAGEKSQSVIATAAQETQERVDQHHRAAVKAIADTAREGLKAGEKISKGRMARKGGLARAAASKEIKAFAIGLFDAGAWGSTSKARDELWPKVKAESVRLRRPMTDTRGPQTLYEWLLQHKKETR